MKLSKLPFLFVFSLCAGIWVTDQSWNGQLFVYIGEQRAPASTRSVHEYTSLDRKTLYRSANVQLMSGAEVVRSGGYAGLRFGHPLVKKSNGARAFGCQVKDRNGVFNKIELTFVGTGISESGGQPRMVVTAPCRALKNINKLETVWVPMADILASNPRDQELQLFGKSPVGVRLVDIPSQWPQSWVLWSVRLFRDDNPEESLMLDARALKEARPKMLTFNWTPDSPQ